MVNLVYPEPQNGSPEIAGIIAWLLQMLSVPCVLVPYWLVYQKSIQPCRMFCVSVGDWNHCGIGGGGEVNLFGLGLSDIEDTTLSHTSSPTWETYLYKNTILCTLTVTVVNGNPTPLHYFARMQALSPECEITVGADHSTRKHPLSSNMKWFHIWDIFNLNETSNRSLKPWINPSISFSIQEIFYF